MPYKSKAQLRFMHARHPAIARRWDETYGSIGDIPERVTPKAKKLSRGERNKKDLNKR